MHIVSLIKGAGPGKTELSPGNRTGGWGMSRPLPSPWTLGQGERQGGRGRGAGPMSSTDAYQVGSGRILELVGKASSR